MTFDRFALLTALLVGAGACTTASEDAGPPQSDAGDASLSDAPHTNPPGPVPDSSAGGCNDDQGPAPGTCPSPIADGQACASYVSAACIAMRVDLKNRPAYSAVACILGETAKEACGTTTLSCGEQALQAACDDSAADIECNAIVAACGSPDAGAADAGGADAADASGHDASDAAADDAGDAGTTDATVSEAGGSEAGTTDAGASDAIAPPPEDAGPRRSGTTFAACKAYLNGMKESGRSKMESCMTTSCGYFPCPDGGATCGGGLHGCFLTTYGGGGGVLQQ